MSNDSTTKASRFDNALYASFRILAPVLFLLITLSLSLKLLLVFTTNINWDEFHYLSFVYSHLRGELTDQFQTFHVHFYGWLRFVSDNEANQIIAARLTVYFLSLASCALTYHLARHYFDKIGALFVVFCYLSFSYIVDHSTSFRPDPIIAFLCLLAICLALRKESILAMSAAGAAIGLAMMFSVKTVFFLPILIVVILANKYDKTGRLGSATAFFWFCAALIVGFLSCYFLHSLIINATASADTFLKAAASKVILPESFLAGPRYFFHSLVTNAVFWITFFYGVFVLLYSLVTTRESRHRMPLVVLAAFLLPPLTIFFYRNAFPYYFVFIMSPAVLVCGLGLRKVLPNDESTGYPLIAWSILLSIFVSSMVHTTPNLKNGLSAQRETISTVHRMFEEPVPYIDSTTMIASFPKVGFFMSTWGMESYLESNYPDFRELLKNRAPKFLLASKPILDLSKSPTEVRLHSRYALRDSDFFVLKDNFVHHWGHIYVAGKAINFTGNRNTRTFEMLIPGSYMVESDAPVIINGTEFEPGSTVDFSIGSHVAWQKSDGTVTLRWAHLNNVPPSPGPTEPLYKGFL